MSSKKFQIHKFAFLSILKLTVFISISFISKGQSLSGTYKFKDEYLRFENDSIYFRLICCGGIYDEYEASGTYKIKKNRIIIQPNIEVYNNKLFKSERKKQDSIFFLVKTLDTSKEFASLVFYDKNKNLLLGQEILLNQKVFIRKITADRIDSIRIMKFGYIPIALKIDNNFNYEIEIVKGKDKNAYQDMLNTEKGGFKFEMTKNTITLYRPRPSKTGDKYYLLTYEK